MNEKIKEYAVGLLKISVFGPFGLKKTGIIPMIIGIFALIFEIVHYTTFKTLYLNMLIIDIILHTSFFIMYDYFATKKAIKHKIRSHVREKSFHDFKHVEICTGCGETKQKHELFCTTCGKNHHHECSSCGFERSSYYSHCQVCGTKAPGLLDRLFNKTPEIDAE